MIKNCVTKSDIIEVIGKTLQEYKDNICGDTKEKQSEIIQSFATLLVKNLTDIPIIELVPLCVYEQVCWERNVAIEQLNDLGYPFGEKVLKDNANEFDIDKFFAEFENEIKFSEKYVSEYDTTTLYFSAPKELLLALPARILSKEFAIDTTSEGTNIKYKTSDGNIDVSFTDISIEDGEYPTVQIGPVIFDGKDTYTTVDWYDIDFPYDVIEKILDKEK